MKWEDLRRSKNVEDRRGTSNSSLGRGGGQSSSGSGMGGLFNLLFLLPGKSKWIVIGIILISLLGGGSFFGGLGDLTNTGVNNSISVNEQAQTSDQGVTDDEFEFVSAVLASTEDFWHQEFSENSLTYDEPDMVIYEDGTATDGCGFGSAQAGPFYCPADQTVYIDLSFWRDLSQNYGAPGDFAMAYVIAHEVGHHVQNEIGIMDEYQLAIRNVSESQRNELNVRLELQADYLAGAWAKYAEEQGLLEAGDINEALQAAFAVGDDTIQERAYGRVVPDSFTHGSAEQRQGWFMYGFQEGDLQHADTFSTYLDFE